MPLPLLGWFNQQSSTSSFDFTPPPSKYSIFFSSDVKGKRFVLNRNVTQSKLGGLTTRSASDLDRSKHEILNSSLKLKTDFQLKRLFSPRLNYFKLSLLLSSFTRYRAYVRVAN